MYRSVKEYHRHRPTNSNTFQPCSTNTKHWKSVDEGLSELQKMSRRQLIQLFLECKSQETMSFNSGDASEETVVYDGYLLNNGPVLVIQHWYTLMVHLIIWSVLTSHLPLQSHVTNFITNTLFGGGQQWLGKVYFRPDGKGTIRMGKNRFICKKDGERLDRTFDCYIGPSATCNQSAASQATVIINDYAKRCPKWSPPSLIWGGMVDELRVIRLSKKKGDVILLGMGYFNWSGGVWNSAPFCLVKRSSHNSQIYRSN